MKGCAPFEAPDGERAPSADKPLDLILYALRSGQGVQVVRFDSTIVELRVAQTPPAYTCTSASKLHEPEPYACMRRALDGLPPAATPSCGACREAHAALERCSTCGELVDYHAFPGRGLRRSLLVVDAPASTGENLRGPTEERDGYLLLHIPRATLDAFDEELTRRIILPGGNGALRPA